MLLILGSSGLLAQSMVFRAGTLNQTRLNSMIPAEPGFFLISGYVVGAAPNVTDCQPFVSKLDANFNEVWTCILQKDKYELTNIYYDPSGGGSYFAIGAQLIAPQASGVTQGLVWRLSTSGNTIFQRHYDITDNSPVSNGNNTPSPKRAPAFRYITPVGDIGNGVNNYLITGYTNRGTSLAESDFLALVIKEDGSVVWSKGYDELTSANSTPQYFVDNRGSDAIVTKKSINPARNNRLFACGASNEDNYIVQIDPTINGNGTPGNGAIINSKRYSTPIYESAYDLLETSDGNLVMVGINSNSQNTAWNVIVQYIDADDLRLIWAKSYTAKDIDRGYSATIDENDILYINGSFKASTAGASSDLFLLTVDIPNNGDILSNKTRAYGGTSGGSETAGLNSGLLYNGVSYIAATTTDFTGLYPTPNNITELGYIVIDNLNISQSENCNAISTLFEKIDLPMSAFGYLTDNQPIVTLANITSGESGPVSNVLTKKSTCCMGININGPSTVCLGSSAVLSATVVDAQPGQTFTYSWNTVPVASPLPISTSATITVTPTANIGYSVTVTRTNGSTCTATAVRNITVDNHCCNIPNPNPPIYRKLVSANTTTSALFLNVTSIGTTAPGLYYIVVEPNVTLTVDNTSITFNSSVRFVMKAGSKIVVNSGRTLNLNGTILYGCDKLWKGIEVLGTGRLYTTGTPSGNRVIIRDAEVAVKASITSPGVIPTLSLKATDFFNNVTGVSLENTTTTSAAINYSSGNLVFAGTAPMLPHYTTNVTLNAPRTGIYISNQNVFVSGDVTAGNNRFRHLNNGILAINSSLVVVGSIFEDIKNFEPSPINSVSNTNTAAINCIGLSNTTRLLDINGNAPGSPFLINKATQGIITSNMNVSINNTDITNVEMGIMVQNMSSSQSANIQAVRIRAALEGIRGLNIAQPTFFRIKKQSNIVINRGLVSALQLDALYPFGRGVYLSNVNGTTPLSGTNPISNIIVESCTIDLQPSSAMALGYEGISLLSSSNNTINANSITINVNTGNSYGIRLSGSSSTNASRANYISANNILGTTTASALNLKGISVESAPNNIVDCNVLQNTDIGLAIMGDCTGTRIVGNDFNAHYYGLYFNSVAVTGAQTNYTTTYGNGNPTISLTSHGNRWLVSAPLGGFQAYHAATSNNPFILNVVSNSAFTYNTYNSTHPEFSPSLPANLQNVFFTQSFSADPLSTYTCGGNPLQALPDSLALTLKEQSVANGTYEPIAYQEDLAWQAEKYLLEKLDAYPALVQSNLDVENFKDSISLTPTEDYLAIQKAKALMEKGDASQNSLLVLNTSNIYDKMQAYVLLDSLYGANAIDSVSYTNGLAQIKLDIAAIEATTVAVTADKTSTIELSADGLKQQNDAASYNKQGEENLHVVNAIYLQTFAKLSTDLSEEQWQTLYSVAQQCPYTGGEAVYQARAMLSAIRETVYDDDAACEEQGVNWKKAPIAQDNNLRVMVMPNPASTSVTFSLAGQSNPEGEFSLYDGLGQMISTLSWHGNTLQISVNELPSGLYYYTFRLQDGTSVKGKLSVIN